MNHPEFGFALIAAAANILGAAAVTWRARWSLSTLETLVALSAGFMISVTIVVVHSSINSRISGSSVRASTPSSAVSMFTPNRDASSRLTE